MSSNSNQYICVGTKRISIDEEEYGGDACISLFRLRKPKQRSSSSSSPAAIEGRDWRSPSPRESFDGNSTVDDCLHLMATDGELTFYKRWVLLSCNLFLLPIALQIIYTTIITNHSKSSSVALQRKISNT